MHFIIRMDDRIVVCVNHKFIAAVQYPTVYYINVINFIGFLHRRSTTVVLRLHTVFELLSQYWWRSSHDCLRFCTFSHASRGTHHASAQLCDVLLRSLALFGNHRRSVAFNRTQWRFECDYIYIQLMKFDTFITGVKQIMYISGSLIDFQRSST